VKALLVALLATLLAGAAGSAWVPADRPLPSLGDTGLPATWLAISTASAAAAGERPAAAPRVVIPAHSAPYRIKLQREVTSAFGLTAPVARFAAQIHQESGWRPDARSPFAKGLTQFTPPTAEWIAQAYPALHPPDPWDPHWAIRAQVTYMRHLLRQVQPAASECDLWAFALSAYNGGGGWVRRDRRLAESAGADPERWFGHVELHTRRAAWARDENREYVRRILLRLEDAYVRAGWPGQRVCV
jgi:soluble lytic murein transglycosylase-like protein